MIKQTEKPWRNVEPTTWASESARARWVDQADEQLLKRREDKQQNKKYQRTTSPVAPGPIVG